MHFHPAFSRTLLSGLLLSAGFALPVQAQNLQELYQDARSYDAVYLAAQAQYRASLAKVEQSRAGLLPTARLSASASFSQVENENTDRDTNSQNVTLSASQPLYRPVNWRAREQALKSLQAAQAQLEAAEQDLVLRTAQAYFDVLAAQDSLAFVQAQKAAVGEQLALARRSFELGTATITDTREAQARFDQTTALVLQP